MEDIWTKRNITNYCSDPYECNDKNYSKKQQKIRKLIREEDIKTKREGRVIDWGYMLKGLD